MLLDITLTESEMWIAGGALSIILMLLGVIGAMFNNQFKSTLIGMSNDLGEVKINLEKFVSVVERHDKELGIMKLNDEHLRKDRADKIQAYDKELEELKKDNYKTRELVLIKLKAITPNG